MKKIVISGIFILAMMQLSTANETRMGTLMAPDYLDDPSNIGIYPQHIIIYQNNFYGDIATQSVEDYGIIMTPDRKYGAIALWQAGQTNSRFNIGYGVNLKRFDLGIFLSPVEHHTQFGFGIGRAFFTRRLDLSFIRNDETNNKWYQINLRLSKRVGDILVIPKYQLNYNDEPLKYSNHRIGLMLQRFILNEGFVFLIAEYVINTGNIESEHVYLHTGLEVPLSRIVLLRFGAFEQFTDGFETPTWQTEPGIGLQIREFNIDFHLNKEWFFNKDVTLFKSVGLDLNFGRF